MLDPAEQNLKVPAWLNDVTLYHNRGDTTFVGENSYYGDFFGLDDLFTENPRVVRGMIDIYKTWIRDFGVDGFRIDTMKHVNDEFWQEFGPEVLGLRQAARASASSSCSARSSTPRRASRRTSPPATGCRRCSTSRSRTRPATSPRAAADRRELTTFFAGDDWYTDADSNVYQLPTFLGNHDMGRIGGFVQADNPGAGDAEWVARDRLAHELMYFSRGNPVVYYGDEQGFTGCGGDQVARQTMFASQVPDYLDDDLLGTDATHAQDNFVPSHPLYRSISGLAALTRAHPALRDGAQQHRYAADGAGVYAFSRIDRERPARVRGRAQQQRAAADRADPDLRRHGRRFTKVYGDGARLRAHGGQRRR